MPSPRSQNSFTRAWFTWPVLVLARIGTDTLHSRDILLPAWWVEFALERVLGLQKGRRRLEGRLMCILPLEVLKELQHGAQKNLNPALELGRSSPGRNLFPLCAMIRCFEAT